MKRNGKETTPVPMNLEILNPSRKFQKPGDIFVFKPKGFPYYFGRVIRTDGRIGPMTGCLLIYLYDVASGKKDEIPELSPNRLLVPPIMTNRQAWLRGYFETIARVELRPDDVLKTHCFLRRIPPWRRNGKYYDADGRELPEPVEPVGDWCLHSYRTIDDAISDALDIPRVPDDDVMYDPPGVFSDPDDLEDGRLPLKIVIRPAVAPLERGDLFEDPIEEALRAEGIGEWVGAGTQLDEEGASEIDFAVTNVERAVEIMQGILRKNGAPEGGTKIIQYAPERKVFPLSR